MAQWSEKRAAYEHERALVRANAVTQSLLEERKELFAKFRAAGSTGYSVWVVTTDDRRFVLDRDVILKDDFVGPIHFGLKIPGAYPMRIKSITQLYRLAKGVPA